MSVETQLIYRHMKTVPVGAIVTYEELQEVGMLTELPIAKNQTAYQRVRTARESLAINDGICFDVIRAEDGISGLIRLDNDGAVAQRSRDIHRQKGRARKIRRKLAAVDYDQLSNQSKIRWNVNMTVATIVERMSDRRAVATLTGEIERNGLKVYTLGETTKMFESQRAAGKV